MRSSTYRAICARSGPSRGEKIISDVPYLKFPRSPSCTVFLRSSIEPREQGYMLFVYVWRIDQRETFAGTGRYLQNIGVRVYGPVVDRGLLEAQRNDLEQDAHKFFSKPDCLPLLIRSRTHLNPRIKYQIVRA